MTTYDIVQERGGVFEAWAVTATGLDGQQRYVSRYMSLEQAQTMIDRLEAMAKAQRSALDGLKPGHPRRSPAPVQGSKGDLKPRAKTMNLRVVVRTGPASRSPYSWAIIDDLTEKVFRQSDHGFRTSGLAWEAGTVALGQFRASIET
jgi:hypothetical protein